MLHAGREFVRALLPESLRRRKRVDDHRVRDGIVWKFRTGTAWRDVPQRYGPWTTLHPIPPTGHGGHLGGNAPRGPGEGRCSRCSRRHRLADIRPLHHRSGPPARWPGREERESQPRPGTIPRRTAQCLRTGVYAQGVTPEHPLAVLYVGVGRTKDARTAKSPASGRCRHRDGSPQGRAPPGRRGERHSEQGESNHGFPAGSTELLIRM
ncbi:transposase [Streptomyces sp. NPDC002926]